MHWRWYTLAVVVAAIVGIGIGVGLHARSATTAPALPTMHGQAVWTPGQRLAPPFELKDQYGGTTSLDSLRGRISVISFLDSQCKEACPIEGRLLGAAISKTNSNALLVVVSINPKGDTPAAITRAISEWHLPTDTLWLTGTRAQLKPVWDAYQVQVEKKAADIMHSTPIYLIDRKGNQRAAFVMPFIAGLVTDDLTSLGGEKQ